MATKSIPRLKVKCINNDEDVSLDVQQFEERCEQACLNARVMLEENALIMKLHRQVRQAHARSLRNIG